MNSQYDPDRLNRIEATIEKIAESQQAIVESQKAIAESQKGFAESQKEFDKRIARLTERHDALAQSAEIFRHEMDDLTRDTNLRFAQTAAFINQLAQIVQAHERRLDNLDSGRQ